MPDRINIALINGGPRDDRFCETVTIWAGSRIWERRGFTLDLIDPGSLPLSAPDLHESDGAVQTLRQRLARADAFTVVMPAQIRDVPATLGHMLDCADTAWRGKPVGFVACDDFSAEPPAIERLRFMLGQRQAVALADIVRLDRSRTRLDADGEPVASDPVHAAMDSLLAQLHHQTMTRKPAHMQQAV